MKLLYSSMILLITLVIAVQNFSLSKGSSRRSESSYCSPECEFKYFKNLQGQRRTWVDMFLPLPTSKTEWNETCSVTSQFLNCSSFATVGCRERRPPMVRLAQIRDAYGYMCYEGAEESPCTPPTEFLQVLPCLGEYYNHTETEVCVQQRKNKEPQGPDGDFCIEIENVHNCAVENAMEKCGNDASEFISIYVQKTHQVLKEIVNCDKVKNRKHLLG